MDRRPIGVFDSGLGGLTVAREIRKFLPGEDIIYFGDTARVPYGTKSKNTVTRFSVESIRFLLKFNVKLIVVACNTASSLSLPSLRRIFNVPMIGVIQPGVEGVLRATDSGEVGVIGTRATVLSGVYERYLKKIKPSLDVTSRACPLFVPLVEEGWLNNGVTSRIVSEYLEDLKEKGIDTLILGCTHYPLLKPLIKRFMGKGVKLIDSAFETAKSVKALLAKEGLLSDRKRSGRYKYFVTDEPAVFKKIGGRFLKKPIKPIKRVRV